MRDTLPLRPVLLAAAAVLAALSAAGWLYFRSLEGAILADAPAAVAEVAADPAAQGAAEGGIARARARGGTAALDEAAANRVLFAEHLADADRDARLSFDPPFARLRIAQKQGGRWLNADLMVQPYAGEKGLGFAVLSGKVGGVSISRTEGEWARRRIEIQLAHDLAGNPRTAALFAGLADAKVTPGGLELTYVAGAGGD